MPKARRSPATQISNTLTNEVVNGRIKSTGRFAPGFSGLPGGDAGRARRQLNLATIQAMQEAFNRGGRQAIDKVMRQQPAVWLKMLVLLVPRELEVTHSGGVKAMSDEQIEAAIEAIKAMLAAKEAKVINGVAEPTPLPALPASVASPAKRERTEKEREYRREYKRRRRAQARAERDMAATQPKKPNDIG